MATEKIWDMMLRMTSPYGGGLAQVAISAIDLALWDLKGKLLKQPVYALIGDETLAATARFVELRKAHAALRAARSVNDSSGFAAALAICRGLAMEEATPLLQNYELQTA